jgi:hypothetical protein
LQKAPIDLTAKLLQLDNNGLWDPIFFRKGIQILHSFSLIKKSKVENVYSVHPLVHSWSRDRITKPRNELTVHHIPIPEPGLCIPQDASFSYQSEL